jgi:hypothetical protein
MQPPTSDRGQEQGMAQQGLNGTILKPVEVDLCQIFQEIQKIRSAILGKANCRIQELPHMLGFTHTGPIGIMIFIL